MLQGQHTLNDGVAAGDGRTNRERAHSQAQLQGRGGSWPRAEPAEEREEPGGAGQF